MLIGFLITVFLLIILLAIKLNQMENEIEKALNEGWAWMHPESYEKIDTAKHELKFIDNEVFFREV